MKEVVAENDFGSLDIALIGELPLDKEGQLAVNIPIEDRFRSFDLRVVEKQNDLEIGFAQITFWFRKTDFKTFSIDEIWLDEVSVPYCNNGIGTWLLSLFEKWAGEFGAESITADLSMSKVGLRRKVHFFSKNGYAVVRKAGSQNLGVYKKLVPDARIPGEIGKGRVVRDLNKVF